MIHDSGISKEIKEKIIKILEILFPKSKIYLFGSRAIGKYTKFSDIDLAVDEGKEIEWIRIGEARSMLAESNIPYKIDIVDLHQDENLKKRILSEGVLWKI